MKSVIEGKTRPPGQFLRLPEVMARTTYVPLVRWESRRKRGETPRR